MKFSMLIKRKNLWINIFKLLVICYLIVGGDYSIYQLLKQAYQIHNLNSEIKDQEESTVRLRSEIRCLKTDRSYIEKIAREQYRMAEDKEEIFLIQP